MAHLIINYSLFDNSPPRQANEGTTDQEKLNKRKVNLLVSDMKCTNLPAMDSAVMGGVSGRNDSIFFSSKTSILTNFPLFSIPKLSDPFVLFASYPKSMLWNKGWPSTEVITRNLNPVWKEAIHLVLDGDARSLLDGSMLYMTVMDEDLNGDDIIGTVALNLKDDLCRDLNIIHSCDFAPPLRGSMLGTIRKSINMSLTIQNTKISKPILRNGQEFGMLECTITSAYLTAKETKVFLRENSKQPLTKRAIVRTF